MTINELIEKVEEYETTWFIKKSKTKESPMQISLDNSIENNHKINVSRQIENNRIYASYKDTDNLRDIIKNYGNIHLYELIKPDQPVNLYFDIEFPETSQNEQDVFVSLIELVDKLMKECFNESFDMCDVYLSGSVGKGKLRNIEVTKVSWHMVIKCNSTFKNMKDIKKFMNFIKHRIDNPKDAKEQDLVKYLIYTLDAQVLRVIDFTVYGNNQNMKLPYQSKFNCDRIQKPHHEHDLITSHFCGNYDDEDLLNFFDTSNIPKYEYNQTIKEKNTMLNSPAEKLVFCSLYQDFKPKVCIPNGDELAIKDDNYIIESIDNTDQCYEVWFGICCAIKNMYKSNETGFKLFNNYSLRSPKYNFDTTRQLWDTLKPIDGGYNKGTLINLANKCNPHGFKQVRNINYIKQLVSCDHTFNQITYNSKFVKPYPYTKYECIIAMSPMGSGKSYQIGNMLNNIDITNKKVLVLSPRRLFAASITGDLNRYVKNHNFVCYSDVEQKTKNLKNVKHLVCQMESLHFLNADFDIVIADEIVSCLSQFSSSETMKSKLNLVCNKFISIWKNAKLKLVCDAFIDVKTIKFIEQLEKKEKPKQTQMDCFASVIRTPYEHVVFIKNETLPVARKAVNVGYCSKGKPLYTQLMKSLKEGKKCVFVTASKDDGDKFIEEYNKRFRNKPLKYKFYHGKSNENDDDLYNVNEKWIDLDLVMYTTKITVGVNFDKLYYDQLFVYSSAISACPRDIFQATMRVRHLKDNIMYYSLFTDHNKKFTVKYGFSEYKDVTINDIKNKIIEKSQKEDNFENLLKIQGFETEQWHDMPLWLFNNHVYNTCEKVVGYFCHEMLFSYYLRACNYTNQRDNECMTEIYKIDPIEYCDYNSITYTLDDIKIIQDKNIREKHNITSDELNKLQKYKYDCSCEEFKEKGELYNFYFNPNNYAKSKYFNILFEKRYGTICLHNKEKREQIYKEMSEKKAQRLFIIRHIIDILKLSSTTDKGQKIIDIDLKVHSKEILEKRKEWFELFKLREQDDKEGKKKPTEIMMTINTIRQIFKEWSGSTIKSSHKSSKIINGNRITTRVYKVFPPLDVDITDMIIAN